MNGLDDIAQAVADAEQPRRTRSEIALIGLVRRAILNPEDHTEQIRTSAGNWETISAHQARAVVEALTVAGYTLHPGRCDVPPPVVREVRCGCPPPPAMTTEYGFHARYSNRVALFPTEDKARWMQQQGIDGAVLVRKVGRWLRLPDTQPETPPAVAPGEPQEQRHGL